MEIAELNLIGNFEAGIKCLQNPSLVSNLSVISKVPRFNSFWTYGALIIAVFATFSNLFNRLKMLIHQIRLQFLNWCQNSRYPQNFDQDDFDFDFSDDEIDGDTPSSSEESDDEEMDSLSSEDNSANEVFRYAGNDEGQNGNLTLRRRNGFSLSDFSAGKSVVQLWDSFGLSLDFEDDEDEISIWDLDRDVKISSGRQGQVAAAVAEKVVLTADVNGNNGGVGFGTYDSRMDETSPAIYAAWRPRRRVAGQTVE